ncbi:MAG: hypothetical protein ACOX64_00705 [Candidatus Merdivicinus sp.]|jgi:hypothetical protein
MKLYLISDYCRIDGETADFAEKEFRGDFTKCDAEISLFSARNQMVSFQLVAEMENGETLTDFDLSFTPLTGPTGSIPADYEVFIEWFHRIEGAFLPDMLLPYGKCSLDFRVPLEPEYHAGQKAGALWIDLFVPEAARKGRYEGTLRVRANQTEKEFAIRLKVYSCMVPYESRIIADLNNYADNISPSYPSLAQNPDRYRDGSYLAVERQFFTMAREHRCLFQNLNYLHSGKPVESFAPDLTGSGKTIRVKDWTLFDEHFGPYLDGSAFKGSRRGAMPVEFMFTPFNLGWPASLSKWGEKGFKTEYRRILWEFTRHFEEKGWTSTNMEIMFNHKKEYRFLPSTQDEIWYEHDEEILDYMADVMRDITPHSSAKFVFRADSSNHYGDHSEKYADLFQMWVSAMTMYAWYPERVQIAKNHGSILWIYGWYGEGMTIDLPLNAFLTQPMICFMTGATGFCSFWNAVGWGDSYKKTPFVNAGQSLFYPGFEFGAGDVLPSLRMKVLRNQMQLADLMMTTDGLDVEAFDYQRRDLEQAVNECFGYADNSAWWKEKPPFADTPPRYWKYGEEVTLNHYKGRSPKIIDDLRRRVYRRLG